jgi:MFS family permease
MSRNSRSVFAGLSRSTVLLAFASFFTDVSTELLYPILPVFLTETLKTTGGIVGLVEGLAQATQNIVQGFSGWLSDRLQRRKAIALVGYSIAAVAKPLMGFSTAWQGVLAARVIDRSGTGLRSAPRDALVAASVDAPHRGKAFGLEGFGDNLGAFVGPLVALVLLNAFQVPMRAIFFIAAVPGALSVAMIAFVRDQRVAVSAKATLDLAGRRFPAAYWKYLAATALFGLGNSSNAFLILQTRDVGVSLQRTIGIYAVFNLVAAIASYPAGYLSDRFGKKPLVALGLMVFVATYVGFAVTRDIRLIAACFVFYGLYQGISRSVGKALAADLVPESIRASGLGWYTATIGLTGLAASLVAGQLWDRVGHSAVFFYGASLGTLGLIALLALLERVPSRHAQ